MKKLLDILKIHIFREDLDLQSKWWHRLLKVIFFILFISIVGLIVYESLNTTSQKRTVYNKVSTLDERVTPELNSVGNLLKEKEIFSYSEPYSNESHKSLESFLSDTYCSTHLADNFKKIIDERGVDNLFIRSVYGSKNVPSDVFSDYIKQFGIKCVMLDAYTKFNAEGFPDGKLYFLEPSRDYQDKWSFYKESALATTLNQIMESALGLILQFIFAAIIIVILYYKVFIYILYGKRRKI